MASREKFVCFEDFNKALAESPKTYGRIDLLCGGWPCQDNSIAGSRKGHAGEKSGLFKEFCRVLRLFSPRWFIGENVPGLLSVNAGKDFCETLSVLQDIGYGLSWRILDSQYFGVPQQRRRLFIVGHFGKPCPPEILFEPKGHQRNHQEKQKVGKVRLCISTRDGQQQDPSSENLVAFCLGTDLRGVPRKMHTENLVCNTITQKAGNRIQGNIATTIDPIGEGEIAGISRKLDAPRGVVIGNAVTVNVARWIGERIMQYDRSRP